MENAVHFWPKEPSFSEVIENVYYETPVEADTTLSGWSSMIFNILKLRPEKRVSKVEKGEYLLRILMCPELRNSPWRTEIMQNFTKPDNLVVHPFV